WTAVRSYALMSNVFRWTGQLAGGDRVRLPFADVAIAAIDPADVAEVVACCLLESGHAGRAYPVSGPEALTPAEQVAAVGRALGRSLGFEPVPAAEARRELAATTPAPFVDAFFRYYDDGEIDETTVVNSVRRITGLRPGTLAGYLAREPVARRLSAETSAPGSREGSGGSRCPDACGGSAGQPIDAGSGGQVAGELVKGTAVPRHPGHARTLRNSGVTAQPGQLQQHPGPADRLLGVDP